jgi:hypothetical protein
MATFSPAPDETPRLDSITQVTTSHSAGNRNGSDAATGAFLSSGPVRMEIGFQELYPNRPSKDYSSLSEEEIKKKKRDLERQLDRDEQTSREPYTRHRADMSDSHPHGPWARKIILALGTFRNTTSHSGPL